METLNLTILEMYDINALIFGFPGFSPGFLNEKNPDLKESTKRIVSKAGKVIQALLKDIDEQRARIKTFVPEDFVSEDKTEEEIAKELGPIRKEKEDELLKSTEKVTIEQPLFSLVANLSFPNNYTFLYDKIFKE